MTVPALAPTAPRIENPPMIRPDRRLPRRARLGACLGALALLTAGCAAQRPVHFASDPPGALVRIDGVDSGFVTPCRLELEDRSSRRVDIELAGFQTATRYLTLEDRGELVYWRDAVVHYNTWNFPLWLGARDFFVPYKSLDGEAPSRLFVRLQREADL